MRPRERWQQAGGIASGYQLDSTHVSVHATLTFLPHAHTHPSHLNPLLLPPTQPPALSPPGPCRQYHYLSPHPYSMHRPKPAPIRHGPLPSLPTTPRTTPTLHGTPLPHHLACLPSTASPSSSHLTIPSTWPPSPLQHWSLLGLVVELLVA